MAQAQSTGGISRELARDRSQQVSEIRYTLSYDLIPGATDVDGDVKIRFSLRRTSPLLLDFRRGHVTSVQINGLPSPVILENGHLELFPASLKRGENEIHIAFTVPVTAAGSALTRFKDHADDSEYIYSLFVPMDASMAFPCFDQPDLKARFKLDVTTPDSWTVISNTSAVSSTPLEQERLRTEFAETAPLSTYLFAFAAGPFRKVGGPSGGPAVYARASLQTLAQAEVEQLRDVTARGIEYFSDYFAQPFPFPKYDTVLIPGLAYSGMEHAGATFLREESVLFRTAPTRTDRLKRDVLVLHELAHQWFGDLVTMRWFDDLWLKEGFVQYMAFDALDTFEPTGNIWKYFYELTKPAAYEIDSTQGTTPIYQDIPDLRDAKSAYGAIVYSKAPGVLRQLAFVLGEKTFRDGVRTYLREHAFKNADWNDLVGAFERASGQQLSKWADVWIHRRGMPQVDVAWTCDGGQLGRLTLSQKGVLNTGDVWPMSTQVLLDYGDQEPVRLRADMNGRTTNVAQAAGKPCPRHVFANDQDFAYGRFLLDEISRKEVMRRVGTTADPFRRALLWGALWESVRELQLDPREYIGLAVKLLPDETDESLASTVLDHVTTAMHRYVSDATRVDLAPQLERWAAVRMTESSDANLRIVWFRALQGFSETPVGLGQLKNLLEGRLWIPGVELRSLDRWNMITTLVAMDDPEAGDLFNTELQRDGSDSARKYAYAALAARPTAASKEQIFDEFLRTDSRPEDWIEQSLLPFNSWNQSELTAPYLPKALAALPRIKSDRKIFFLGRWLNAFFQGQTSVAARDEVRRYLSKADIDKDLQLKILQGLDELERAVNLRRQYP